MRNALVLILTLAVIALVIIGLINFDLLLTITGKLIAAGAIIGYCLITSSGFSKLLMVAKAAMRSPPGRYFLYGRDRLSCPN